MREHAYIRQPAVSKFIARAAVYCRSWPKRHRVLKSPYATAGLFAFEGVEAEASAQHLRWAVAAPTWGGTTGRALGRFFGLLDADDAPTPFYNTFFLG